MKGLGRAVCLLFVTAALSLSAAEIVSVVARGVGTTKIDALKDAYRDAIERAHIGTYYDSEQQLKNNVLNDQELTHSNGFIERSEILSEESKDGLVQVRIVAHVKKMALTKRFTEIMPTKSLTVAEASRSLHARTVTEAKMLDDALAIVRNEFASFNPVMKPRKIFIP